MELIPALVATVAAGIFAGAAVYVTFVEHPARMSCGPALALAEFRPSYTRGSIMQALLAIVGTGAGIDRWAVGGGRGWLLCALLLGLVIPFTLLVIFPTNHRLFDDSLDEAFVQTLLTQWGRLHVVRSLLGVGAFAGFAILLARS
jgi:hypothetical protein